MYVRVETITPEMAKELLKKNDGNRKLSMSVVKKYTEDIKNGKWEENGESISISKSGVLLNGQHRLNAIIYANIPINVVVVHDVPDSVHTFDRGFKRTRTNILQMNGYPISLSDNAFVGGIQFLLKEAGLRDATDAQFMSVIDKLGNVCPTTMSLVRSGSHNAISRKAGCIAAAVTALFFGVDCEVIKRFFTTVNSGFIDGQSQFSAIVVRNHLMNISGYGSGGKKTRETYFITLRGIVDFSNCIPRKKIYDTEKAPPMANAIRETIKEWLEE